jgi:hypothetical protein
MYIKLLPGNPKIFLAAALNIDRLIQTYLSCSGFNYYNINEAFVLVSKMYILSDLRILLSSVLNFYLRNQNVLSLIIKLNIWLFLSVCIFSTLVNNISTNTNYSCGLFLHAFNSVTLCGDIPHVSDIHASRKHLATPVLGTAICNCSCVLPSDKQDSATVLYAGHPG